MLPAVGALAHDIHTRYSPPLAILLRSVFGMTVASVNAERSVCQYR